MPIDWFTVGAQLLNFLILVGLMKRFLYRPVLDAIAAREHKIAAELAEAAATKAEAHRQQDDLRQKNLDFDAQRAALLREARDAATAERERLLRESHAAADAAAAQRAQALLSDAQTLRGDITRLTQQQVVGISRRVLGDLAGVSLETRICEVFVERLQAVEGPALATLRAALEAASDAEPARLRGAFELAPAQRAAIQAALARCAGRPVALVFETAPELVAGVELLAQGRQLAWTVADYLAQLSSDLEQRLGATAPA